MKKRNLILTISLLGATAATAQTPYQITGTWKGHSGNTVRLSGLSGRQETVIDSAVVDANGKFVLEGKTEAGMKYLKYGEGEGQDLYVCEEPLQVEITTALSTPIYTSYRANVQGGRQQRVYADGQDLMQSVMYAYAQLNGRVQNQPKEEAEAFTATLQEKIRQTITTYMDSTRNDPASVCLIQNFILGSMPLEQTVEFYNNLSAKVKQSPEATTLKKRLDELMSVSVGRMAPDFELATPDGGKLKLSSLRGHYVLLDFWASWCGPCLAEMPNVKAVYEKHHADGLEILGVSLDNEASAWKGAIEKKGLPWKHVSSLQQWKCPIAKLYEVRSIPAMFIIDPQGKIIAKNIRGEALIRKMDEIFAK